MGFLQAATRGTFDKKSNYEYFYKNLYFLIHSFLPQRVSVVQPMSYCLDMRELCQLIPYCWTHCVAPSLLSGVFVPTIIIASYRWGYQPISHKQSSNCYCFLVREISCWKVFIFSPFIITKKDNFSFCLAQSAKSPSWVISAITV